MQPWPSPRADCASLQENLRESRCGRSGATGAASHGPADCPGGAPRGGDPKACKATGRVVGRQSVCVRDRHPEGQDASGATWAAWGAGWSPVRQDTPGWLSLILTGSGAYERQDLLALAVPILVQYTMVDMLKPVPLAFWRSSVGREPVRDWLNELPREDQRVIGRDIAKVQFGWPIGVAGLPSPQSGTLGGPLVLAEPAGSAGAVWIC